MIKTIQDIFKTLNTYLEDYTINNFGNYRIDINKFVKFKCDDKTKAIYYSTNVRKPLFIYWTQRYNYLTCITDTI